MGAIRFSKVVSNLPQQLEPDTIYLVRTGNGFDLYCTDTTGSIAYRIGNAATATKLQTARTITIGNTGKKFDGSADVSWSLAEVVGGGVPETAGWLAEGVDLNMVRTPGFYVQPLDGYAASGTNYPIAQAGTLVVLMNAGVAQIYYAYGVGENPRAFFRTFYSYLGNWSPWREFYHSGNLSAASETASGLVELATAAEAQALASTTVALTPARLADAFKGANQSLSASGYQKLPGGLIIQWGQAGASNTSSSQVNPVSFPISFPSSAILVLVSHIGAVSSVNVIVDQNSFPSLNGFSWKSDFTGGYTKIFWLAIGY